jgi:glutathione peroxidase
MLESLIRKIAVIMVSIALCGCGDSGEPGAPSDVTYKEGRTMYSLIMNDIDGKPVSLSTYRGKVLMMVNVASKCGATPQYKQLQEIYRKYKDNGFVVLGFPANNFGSQEPGSNEEIKNFCTLEYRVTFPMFSKISVKGEDIHPLYTFLTEEVTNPDFAGEITWNFNKFLIGRDGDILARFATNIEPDNPEVLDAIERAIEREQ